MNTHSTQTTAERFHDLYRGSDTHHGETRLTGETEASGKATAKSITVRGPATPELWEGHLAGLEPSIGIPPVQAGNLVRFGVLDLDAYDGLNHQALFWRFCNADVPCTFHIVRSKSRGAHCTVFSEDVPRKLMHAFLLKVCEVTHLQELQERTIETFPGPNDIEPGDSNPWINAPYNGADSTRVSIDGGGERITPEDFLNSVQRISEKEMREYLGAGKKKSKKATKPEPAYKNGLKDAHYPELQSALAYYIGVNGPPEKLSDGEIDLRIHSMLDTAGITDLAKRKEYFQELAPYGRKMRDQDQTKEPKKKDLLQKLCEDFTYFNAGSMQDGFVQLTNEGHREIWPEERIENILIARFLKLTDTAPKREELNAVMDGVKARCMTGPHEQIHSRIARTPDKIYLDLCNDKWEVIEIDRDGWRVVSDPPVYFRRSNESKALPTPVPGGSLDELRPLLNAGDDDQWVLMMGWLVGVFQPIGAFSHIAVEGPEGTAKTTTATNLISVVDPNEVGLCGPPKNEEDFSITAMSAGIVGYDNFSGCKESLSDLFCKASTGMGFRTRTLYKNREVTSIKIKVPILVNGIDSVVMRGDLLRRTIVVHLPVIENKDRRAEEDLEKQYHEAHPLILGALLDAVVCGLKNLSTTVVTNPPSMASFAKWVKACEPALPWPPGAFLLAYHDMQLGASEELFEKDQFAEALWDWASPQIEKGKVPDISSRALLLALNKPIRVEPGRMDPIDRKDWPSLKTIKDAIERVRPLLLKKGLRVEKTKRTKKTKGLWHFESTDQQQLAGDKPTREPSTAQEEYLANEERRQAACWREHQAKLEAEARRKEEQRRRAEAA